MTQSNTISRSLRVVSVLGTQKKRLYPHPLFFQHLLDSLAKKQAWSSWRSPPISLAHSLEPKMLDKRVLILTRR